MISLSSLLNPVEPKSPRRKQLMLAPPGVTSLKANMTAPLLTPSCFSGSDVMPTQTQSTSSSRAVYVSESTSSQSMHPTSAGSSFSGLHSNHGSSCRDSSKSCISLYSPSHTYPRQPQNPDSYTCTSPVPGNAITENSNLKALNNTTTTRIFPGPLSSSPTTIPLKSRTVLSTAQIRDISFTKSPINGPVNYSPFENLDPRMAEYVMTFKVNPFGQIQQNSSHIPYNSGKKDFFEKTGRESFEVFSYSFSVPGEELEFNVMWDYNNGLVRMTPFFKCCRYGKTMPAKMLNQNPGLKDITHSITGGTILAQGYWMPYECAKSICATFCHRIAGALVPLFGPQFPQQCVPPDAPEFGHMVINPSIIAKAAQQAEVYRHDYSLISSTRHLSPKANSLSPGHSRRVARITPDSPYLGRAIDSPYTTETEEDSLASPAGEYDSKILGPRRSARGNEYSSCAFSFPPAPTSNGWTTINSSYSCANKDTRQSPVMFSRDASCEPRLPHLGHTPRLKLGSVSPSYNAKSVFSRSGMSRSVAPSNQAYQLPNPTLPQLMTGKRRMDGEHSASMIRYDRSCRSMRSDPSAYKYSRNQRIDSPMSSPPSRGPQRFHFTGPEPPLSAPVSHPGRPLEATGKRAAAILLMGLSGQEEGSPTVSVRREGTPIGSISAVAEQAMGLLATGNRKRSI
ncbi:uncharacterized protein BROUX77_002727 [Berkeleyomyces rouxiae]|uniref:uncharacterized protein n=1 Tax=Berkeleyomyces rouxiae TaxID=2035830 RepID=UPI003B79798C